MIFFASAMSFANPRSTKSPLITRNSGCCASASRIVRRACFTKSDSGSSAVNCASDRTANFHRPPPDRPVGDDHRVDHLGRRRHGHRRRAPHGQVVDDDPAGVLPGRHGLHHVDPPEPQRHREPRRDVGLDVLPAGPVHRRREVERLRGTTRRVVRVGAQPSTLAVAVDPGAELLRLTGQRLLRGLREVRRTRGGAAGQRVVERDRLAAVVTLGGRPGRRRRTRRYCVRLPAGEVVDLVDHLAAETRGDTELRW